MNVDTARGLLPDQFLEFWKRHLAGVKIWGVERY
jgi:hypothetical protein